MSKAEIEKWAKRQYKKNSGFWTGAARSATGTFKKLADFVVENGR